MHRDCFTAAARLLVPKNSSFRSLMKALTLSVGCTVAMASSGVAMADDASGADVWTVTLLNHYNKAVRAYNASDWATAKAEFRESIALNNQHIEFYDGLLNSCMHTDEYDQVLLAADNIQKLDPNRKNAIAFDYGMALYKMNRFDEAIPWLKRALATADMPTSVPYHPEVKPESIVQLTNPGVGEVVQVKEAPVVKPVVYQTEKLDKKEYLTLDSAIWSESIVLADYEGYEKGDIQFNNPPIAHYHITRILKGPPMNKDIVVRYQFHDMVNPKMPAGWKWDPAKVMPAKGSKWILFIEFEYTQQGALETYQGSYGRMVPTDDNLNGLYQRMDAHNMRMQKAE